MPLAFDTRSRAAGATSSLVGPRAVGEFDPSELAGLPGSVARYLSASIAPGAARATAARVAMDGRIRLGGRWLAFRAHEVIAPREGFLWAARVAGVIWGADSLIGGAGRTEFHLAGVVPVARASGDDVDRSAAGRAAAEAVWVPTALLPLDGHAVDELDHHTFRVGIAVGGVDNRLTVRTLPSGHLASAEVTRWGDPDASGSWGWHRFGMEVTGYGRADGITFPAAGRVGWHFGAPEFADGMFFHYRLTGYRALAPA